MDKSLQEFSSTFKEMDLPRIDGKGVQCKQRGLKRIHIKVCKKEKK